MKNGYKHYTFLFGRDAEYYTSRLFLLIKNPNGTRRPDLVSSPNTYKPRLTIELKSGRNGKGVMVDYQLHYAIATDEDYENLFGRQRRNPSFGFMDERVSYYYDVISRVDNVLSGELSMPYSTIRLSWGDHHIVPHELAFFNFVVRRAMRTGEDIGYTAKDLKNIMRECVDYGVTDYILRKTNPNSWQNLNAQDILALFHNDDSLTTPKGKERVRLLRDIYPQVSGLKRLIISGPNQTKIYILAEKRDEELFDVRLRDVVGRRSGLLEEVVRERESACNKLTAFKFHEGGKYKTHLNGNSRTKQNSQEEFANVLRRLERWAPQNDTDYSAAVQCLQSRSHKRTASPVIDT